MNLSFAKLLIVAVVAMSISCGIKSENPESVPPDIDASLIPEEYSFILNKSNDTISLIETVCSCDKEKLLRNVEISYFPFYFTNDTLVIRMRIVPDPVSQRKVNVRQHFVSSSGDWINGYWKSAGISYDTALVDPAGIEAFNGIVNQLQLQNHEWMHIRENLLTLYLTPRTDNFATTFVGTWTDSLLSTYLISMTTIDENTLKFEGGITGEIITVQSQANEDIVYKSSLTKDTVTTKKEYTYKDDFSKCPNPYHPDWFLSFLDDNRKCTSDRDFIAIFKSKVPENPDRFNVSTDTTNPGYMLLIGNKSLDSVKIVLDENCAVTYQWTGKDSLFVDDNVTDFLAVPAWLQDFYLANER